MKMLRQFQPHRLLPLFVAMGAALALPVQAQSLVDLYESARTFDASYQSAKSQYDATLARAAQAQAAILPSANLARLTTLPTTNMSGTRAI